VPIKNVIGDYFLTDIEKQLYCFKIEGSRIKTYRHKGVRSFRVLHYDTTHYKPVSGSDYKELELMLQKNGLPRMNMMMFGMLKTLGKKEKEEFEPHDLVNFVSELSQHEDQHQELVLNVRNYLGHLAIEKIITPVRRLTEFIEDDLIATDPKFLGTIVSTYQRVDFEHKKVTNTPTTGKFAWLKLILIISIIGLGIGLAYWAYASGIFSNIAIPGLDQGSTTQDLLNKYPTPEALKAAVDRGEIRYDSLPNEIKDMINTVKLPQLTTP